MLGLGRLAGGDGELAVLTADFAVEPEHVAEVVVAALIERPEQADAGLDQGHDSAPGELEGHGSESEDRERDGATPVPIRPPFVSSSCHLPSCSISSSPGSIDL